MDNLSLRNKAMLGMFWKFSERVCVQVASLLVSIVLARILDPSNYVSISVATIFFTLANTIIAGGLNTALIQKKNPDMLDYSTVLVINIVISIIMYAILYITAPVISNIYDVDELTSILRVLGLLLIINSIKSVFGAFISSNLQFKKSFATASISVVVSGVIGIIMALKGCGSWALVAQQLIAGIVETICLICLTKLRMKFRVSFNRLRELFKYGSKIFLATIIGAIYDEVSPLVIGLKFSASDLSFYDKGKSFPSLINSACNDTLNAVLFPVMAKVQDEKTRVLNLTRRFIKTSSFLVFPLLIGFACVAETFVYVVLSEKWLSATVYIQIFSINYLLNFVQTGNLQAIKSLGRSDIVLKMEILKKSIYTVVLVIAIINASSPYNIALVAVINTIIATIINTYPNRKLIGYSYRYQLLDIAPNILIACVMGVCVLIIGLLRINRTLLLLIQVISGVIIYITLAILTKNDSFQYLMNILKGKKRV